VTVRALLDVNVLIALLDAAHVHHRAAVRWMERNVEHGWASCPITQHGCIRIMSQPAYPGARPTAEIAARLSEAAATPHHAFWTDDIDLLGGHALDWRRVLGPRQVTDAYLLAIAVRRRGRFVTFDARVSIDAVPRAKPGHLVRID
jgi:toxin-antitoxin system PIN domain toxin